MDAESWFDLLYKTIPEFTGPTGLNENKKRYVNLSLKKGLDPLV